MKVLSLFSGIGAFEKALKNMKIPYELVGFSEIDKYAVKSYCAIHDVDESMNLGDITKIDENALPKDIDLVTYGFPCQDISLSGKQKGLFNEDGTQTRSGLFFEALRIIETTQPRVAIAENVKNLTSKKFKEQFEIVLDSLESAGYNNYWKVLNAKDFGIPQNRERVFIVSIRKDIDTGCFKFHEGFPLELRLKDLLDDEVDEKFYMSEKSISYICATGTKNFHYEPEIDLEIARPLTSTMHKAHRASQDNYVSDSFLKDDVKATIKDGKPYIAIKQATKKGFAEAVEGDSINFEQPNSKTRRGRVGHGVAQTLTTSPQQGVVVENIPISYTRLHTPKEIDVSMCLAAGYHKGMSNNNPQTAVVQRVGCVNSSQDGVVVPSFVNGDICKTVRASGHGSVDRHSWDMVHDNLRIRKLTPKECFRLMGFEDSDFEKAEAVNSNTQLYKQAGNSIVVPVVEYIIKALLECGALEKEREEKEMELRVNTPTFPEVIEFNFEELKQEITERASAYVNLVYTEGQIQEAKKDRAKLNKFVKALSDERIKVKKEWLKPYEYFEAKIKELDGIVSAAIQNIDSQIKAVEEQEKAEKLEKIKELWESIEHPAEMTFEHVYEGKFMNKSCSMATIEQYMKNCVERFNSDLAALQNLPEFSFEAIEVYKQTLDMHKAISEGKRLAEIQKKKAEAEFAKNMNPPEEDVPGQIGFSDAESFDKVVQEATEEEKMWISFKALLSTSDAFALKDFFETRHIEFEAI